MDIHERPYKCVICEVEGNVEFYRKVANPEEINYLLTFWKLCRPHTQEMEELKEKREIERQVA